MVFISVRLLAIFRLGNAEVHALNFVRQPLRRLTGHTNSVMAVEWFSNGERLITASWDRTANIYDAERGEIVNVLSGWFFFVVEEILRSSYGVNIRAEIR